MFPAFFSSHVGVWISIGLLAGVAAAIVLVVTKLCELASAVFRQLHEPAPKAAGLAMGRLRQGRCSARVAPSGIRLRSQQKGTTMYHIMTAWLEWEQWFLGLGWYP